MLLNIIHLAERADRWQLLQEEFAGQNITNYRVWEGIVDESLIRRGISRAHKNIIRCASEQGLPSVLVGEDDLHFTSPGAYGHIDENNFKIDFSGLTLYLTQQFNRKSQIAI